MSTQPKAPGPRRSNYWLRAAGDIMILVVFGAVFALLLTVPHPLTVFVVRVLAGH